MVYCRSCMHKYVLDSGEDSPFLCGWLISSYVMRLYYLNYKF